MGFCKKCGVELAEDARFCEKCGTPVTIQSAGSESIKMQSETDVRKQSYEGEVRKCPNCGDPIDAFEMICDKCGFNFSTNRMSLSQERLAAQLATIDAKMQAAENSLPFKSVSASFANAL